MDDMFAGKVALVTGASSGIGRATALAFAAAGAKVIIGNRRIPEGEETVRLIEEAGGEAKFIQTDVAIASQVEALVEGGVEAFGRLDFACNNSALGQGGQRLHEIDQETFDRVIQVNLTGLWYCMKYEIPHLLRQGGGSIVNMSSIAGIQGALGEAAYSASKHGIVGLTRSAALDYASRGIRINAVCPGFIDTPIWEGPFQSKLLRSILIALEPVQRLGTSEDVAGAVMWLCSDASAFVTGTAIPVDGGLNST